MTLRGWLSLSNDTFKSRPASCLDFGQGHQSFRSIATGSRERAPDDRLRDEPGISRRNFQISGFALRAPRNDGSGDYVSTKPVLDPLAAESFRPCGSAK